MRKITYSRDSNNMMKTPRRAPTGFCLLCLLLPLSTFAQSEEGINPILRDKFNLTLGIYFPDHDVKISAEGRAEPPDDIIDYEADVALEQHDEILAASLIWNFGEKWGLQTMYFESERHNRTILEEDIEWKDYIVREGTSVGAGIDFKIFRIFFGREFSAGPTHSFGAGVGIHWMEVDAFIEGEFFLNDDSTGFRRESVDAEAPLPNIGAWYLYAPNAKWSLISRFDWLDASINEYSGGLINAAVGLNYQFTDHFGIGANYQYFNLNGDVDKGSWRGELDITFEGLLVYINFNW